MREILFRGFYPCEDGAEKVFIDGEWIKGKWVEGDFCKPCNIVCVEAECDEGLREDIMGKIEDYNVIPETVGQFTGLTDKNGTKIFEGDILEYENTDQQPHRVRVVFEDGAFLINDEGIIDYDLITTYFCLGLKVVGNIHDNPELLGGVDNG